MREDHSDPLRAFLSGPVWAEEAIPALRARMRRLERAAVVERDPERLREQQLEHALLRRFADPDKLLGMLRAKSSISAGDDAEDEPAGP